VLLFLTIRANRQLSFRECAEAEVGRVLPTREILRTAVPKLINAYISETLFAVFRNPTFLIHMEKKLVPLGSGLPLRGKA
jgi:hypothetical protein